MNRNKLLQIISKDLLELSEMTNETANNELVTNTEIDFLSRKAQVIIQGFELFKELNPVSSICLPEKQVENIDISETEDVEEEITETEEDKILVPEPDEVSAEPDFDTEEGTFQPDDNFLNDSKGKEIWFEDSGEPVKETNEDIQEEGGWFENIEDSVFVKEPVFEESTLEEPVFEGTDGETAQGEFVEEPFSEEDSPEMPVENESVSDSPYSETQEDTSEDQMQKTGFSGFLSGNKESGQGGIEVVEEEGTYEEAEPEESKILNETFGQTISQVEKSFNETPVSRLDDSIGINDRFQFIRELFNNDSELFRRTIEDLDKMSDIKDVPAYLNKNFKWKKNEFSLKFIHLIKRRFS